MTWPLLVTDAFWSITGAEIARRTPQVEPVLAIEGRRLDDSTLDRIRISCLSGDAYPARLREILGPCARAPRLEWLHTFSAGTDAPIFASFLDRGVRLTNSSGASAPSIARTVLAVVLALSRDLPGWFVAQQERRWESRRFREVIGDRMTIVGWGPIGQEVARLAQAVGIDVEIVRRVAIGDEPHRVWPLASLEAAVGDADWVVLALPLTAETRGLVTEPVLRAMPARARLVNVGRGELVDEPALVAALRDGRIAGAALDVFATEPLPPDNELWSMPNVIVTPHSSGVTDHTDARAQAIFLDNLEAFVHGEPMRNEVVGA
jgi:phosphoglycerate dehydrogenase-like enzyme